MRKATRHDTREHNTRLVLRTVFRHGPLSRAEIARLTHLTRATVSDIVATLIESGLVAETGDLVASGGRPAAPVDIPDDARHVIAVDVSGEDYVGAVLTLRGRPVYQRRLPAFGACGEQAVQCLLTLIEDLLRQANAPILGIGISTPGLVDAEAGHVIRAVNRGWEDLPLRERITQRFALPTYVANDAHMIALAEYTFTYQGRKRNLAVVHVSEGVGAAVILDGVLFSGDGFAAGEIGHLVIAEDGPTCTCGHRGCLETFVSIPALTRQMEAALQGHVTSRWAEGSRADGRLRREDLFEAFRTGDAAATEIVHRAARRLGFAIATLVSVLDVHEVILAGQFSAFGEPILKQIRDTVASHVLPEVAGRCQITFSEHGDQATMLGTLALVLAKELGIP